MSTTAYFIRLNYLMLDGSWRRTTMFMPFSSREAAVTAFEKTGQDEYNYGDSPLPEGSDHSVLTVDYVTEPPTYDLPAAATWTRLNSVAHLQEIRSENRFAVKTIRSVFASASGITEKAARRMISEEIKRSDSESIIGKLRRATGLNQ